MSNYKVYFNFNVAFPKGRISGKKGNCDITYEGGVEELKADDDLKKFLIQEIQKEYKTGKLFSLDITEIKLTA